MLKLNIAKYVFCGLFLISTSSFCQVDNVGAGHAINFDGLDDYIDLGNIYDNLNLPITISAWVYVDPSSTLPGPVFTSQDNDELYNGFWFFAAKSEIIFEYGDGLGANNPAFRKGKIAGMEGIQEKWTHVCGVMRGATDVDVYINGINIGGNFSGSSDSPMASLFPSDVAKIGYHLSNGVVYRFKGLMDELRIFNKGLSETEIRQQMCKKLTGNETGLIGYWTFDETTGATLADKSSNHFDGVLKGNPTRVFSGAPIGDESTFLYTTSWNNKSLSLDVIEANNVVGNPEGIHIYKVSDIPSQTSGLDLSLLNKPYYGVFVASLDIGNSFDLKSTTGNLCKAFGRDDNSKISWTDLTVFTSIPDRKEVVSVLADPDVVINLGPDKVVCDQASYLLETGIDLTGKSVLWSAGQTSPTITITQSGFYSVQVFTLCSVLKDTVNIIFLKKPTSFSLGTDEVLCILKPKVLKPYNDSNGFEFEWQNGSDNETFETKDFGAYWVTVKNACGVESDTLHISKLVVEMKNIPNIITPNDDALNQHFIVGQESNSPNRLVLYNRWGAEVFNSTDYKNDWDGSGLASGVYFYQLSGECVGEKRGTITISR